MEAKFTKGEWIFSSGSIWAITPFNARVRIADIHRHSPMNGIDSDGNGQLMAAASELYEALTRLAHDCGNLDNPMVRERIAHETLPQALSALAKARGDQPEGE
jgi:hypothetical protein